MTSMKTGAEGIACSEFVVTPNCSSAVLGLAIWIAQPIFSLRVRHP
jgi:hypothetical protein